MSRTVICVISLVVGCAALARAADPFVGTWTADMEKARQTMNLPSSALRDSFKVEAYQNGYKITHIAGNYSQVMIMDFAVEVTPVRNNRGQELDRIRVIRKSPVEIESTSLTTGVNFNYKILPGGKEMQITVGSGQSGKPSRTSYYDRIP